jgi:hypothetical protein
MNPTPHRALWSTASLGLPTLTPWSDATELSDHLGRCCTLSGRMFAMHCAAESARSFMSEHFVTTLLTLLLVLLGLRWGVL